ncbi:MAG: hypothetical protein J1F35_00190 [Erysipelotrichales bacterium]|nr:hypothetical protein [Erysipelotrichales bacterium]
MQYYNHEGKIVSYNEEKSTKKIEARTAEIHFFNGYILKKYYGYTDPVNRIVLDVFEILDRIDDRHLLKVTELLIRKDRYKEEASLRYNFTNYRIDAYTMPIIRDDKVDLFDISIEYILEMIEELQNLFKVLSTYHIEVQDLTDENVILQKNNIVLIDWDRYRISKRDEHDILINNIDELVTLFYDLLYYKCRNNRECEKIGKLLSININNSKSLSLRFKDELKGYKTINEYLHKK